jgi:hypothetical protein
VKRIIGCGLRGILLLVTDVADGGVREVACVVRLKKCVSPCLKANDPAEETRQVVELVAPLSWAQRLKRVFNMMGPPSGH